MHRSATSSRRRWALFGVVLAMLVAAIVCASFRFGEFVFRWIERHPGSDKVLHFLMLGALGFSLNFALHGRAVRVGSWRLMWGSLLVAGAITVEEFSQQWIATRQFDWGDLVANYAGIACADWLVRRWLR